MPEMKLEGMGELEKKLIKMGKKANSIKNKAIKAAAEPILKDAKNEVSIDEGDLKEGLAISGIKTKKDEKYVEVGALSSDLFYSKFLEFGTSKMPAKPFLQPSFENNMKLVEEIIKNELRKGLGL